MVLCRFNSFIVERLLKEHLMPPFDMELLQQLPANHSSP